MKGGEIQFSWQYLQPYVHFIILLVVQEADSLAKCPIIPSPLTGEGQGEGE
jgi:hypothetical protein